MVRQRNVSEGSFSYGDSEGPVLDLEPPMASDLWFERVRVLGRYASSQRLPSGR